MSISPPGKRSRDIFGLAGQAFLELLFPPQCHICDVMIPIAGESVICAECLAQLTFIQSPLCSRCGRHIEGPAETGDRCCGNCLGNTPSFDTARSLLKYQSPVPDLLHRLKYKADSSVTGALGEIIKRHNDAWNQQKCDLIIPVPLHVKRLKRRGFNQSQLLARLAFSDYQEKIALNLLLRAKNTTSQTGLDGVERRRNLRDAFQVTAPKQIEGKTIWLVDDVFTTGTTVSECSETLKKNGSGEVHVWTFARV